MNTRFFCVFLLFSLIGVLILPQNCLAEVKLPELEANLLLNSCQQKLIDEWIDITSSSDFSEPEKQAALFLIRNGIQKKELSYWLEEVPKEYLKTLVKISAFLLTHPDIPSILDKIEKETVKQAVKIAKEWLLENEIKIANGPLKYAYISYKGNKQEPNFHYIISFHHLEDERAEVILEFYSPERVEPKESTGNVLWLNAFPWDFDRWRADGNEKLDPFIFRIKGKVLEKEGGYSWINSSIEITFSEPVPEYPFEPEPSSFLGKIRKAIENEISGVFQDFKDIFDVFTKIREKIPYSTSFEAQVSQPLSLMVEEGELKEIEDSINALDTALEQEIEEFEEETETRSLPLAESGSLPTPDLNELQEKIDDIREMIDALSRELEKIIEEEDKYELEEDEENKDEEQEEITEEDEEIEEETELEQETEEETEENPDQEIPVVLCQRNQSDSPLRNKVIFNEIAWMGSSNSSNDEWIELKNISSDEVNLSGWQILDKDEKIKIIFELEGAISKIPSHQFYLLERTGDDSVPDIAADFIYTGALNNEDEVLYLFDQDCQLQDEIITEPDWQAGDKNSKRTMERKTSLEWQTSANINGTPKAKNSRGYYSSSGGSGSGGGGSGGGAPKPEPEPEPEPSEPVSGGIPNNVIISEVQIADDEFVELYNPTENDINISNWYFSYFSSGRDWNDPWRNKKFLEETIIPAKDYYLIGLKDYPESDWQIYDSSQFSDTSGAVAIFSSNPKNTEENPKTSEQAKSSKIDALAWGDNEEILVKEKETTTPSSERESLARKIEINEQGYLHYIDNNNNKIDFEIQIPSPKNLNQHSYSDLDKDGIIDSYDLETIIIENVSLEPGEYVFKSLIIENNTELVLNSDSSFEGFKGVKINAQNLILKTGSLISADGKGYLFDEGPGKGKIGRTGGGSCSGYCYISYGSGGGYGGIGGKGGYPACYYESIEGGLFYGSLEEPMDLGSGGGNQGGAGGGAIIIELSEKLIIDGQLSANGENGNADHYSSSGAGSGGSIYINTHILEGSGSITTNGGQEELGFGGGGAGGRVAIYYDLKDSFDGKIEAFGGIGFQTGGAGTIFLKSPLQEYGDLIINNNNSEGITQLEENNYIFDSLEVLNSAHFYLPENLNVNDIEVNNAILESFVTATIDGVQFLMTDESSLLGSDQIFLTINTNTLSIQSTSKIIANVNIDSENLFLDSVSSIIADGKGYLGGEGPGAGKEARTNGGSCSGYCFYSYGSGGGYGGIGGRGAYPGCTGEIVEGGPFYGSLEEPMDLGSGGGSQGGAGGGAIRINITNNFTLDGLVSVNGEDGQSKAGGGSGGTVNIRTNTLTGSGFITANGGQGYHGIGGGGAGGRIAIHCQSSDFSGVIQTQGGTGYQNGEDGTIFE